MVLKKLVDLKDPANLRTSSLIRCGEDGETGKGTVDEEEGE